MNYSELPEPVIHHIQSFFNPKEAARTTLLSKSWCSAWSTRPTIDLDEYQFPGYCSRYSDHLDPLMAFAKKAFRRYEESGLRIHTFRLCLKSQWYGPSGFAAKWTSKAIKLGVSDITIRLNSHRNIFVPIDEVFGSENVVRLCLRGLVINRLEVIKCSGLKSLTLDEVQISIDSLCNIFSCCPLIEKLSLLTHVTCLKSCVVEHEKGLRSAGIAPLHKLTSLVLCNVEPELFQSLFLGDMSSKFPVLKDLTIMFCDLLFRVDKASEMYVISSRSLEILSFSTGTVYYDQYKMRRVELDLPNIRKFTFEGECIPKMCFSPTSGDQWDSHVSITHYHRPTTKWFCRLSKLLSNQRGSKIHLVLHLYDFEILTETNDQAGKVKGSNAREVEDLTIYTKNLWSSEIFNYLLDGLFRICRPKMITQEFRPSNDDRQVLIDNDKGTRKNDLLLCTALEQGLAAKSSFSTRSQFLYGLRDLEEVNVQELQDNVWIPQTMASISNDSTSEASISDDATSEDSMSNDSTSEASKSDDSTSEASISDDSTSEASLSDDSTNERRRFRFLLKWKPYSVLA